MRPTVDRLRIRVKTDPVIADADLVMIRFFMRCNRDTAPLRQIADPVVDCVFHQWLNGQGRNKEFGDFNVIPNL